MWGSFLSTDPLTRQFSWVSPYNYAENSPIAHIDLFGLQKQEVISRVYLGECPKVETDKALEKLSYITADVSLPILEEVVKRFNSTASWNHKIPNLPSYLGPVLNAYNIYNSYNDAESARELGDREKELEAIAAAAGTTVSGLSSFVPHPAAKAFLIASGTLIAQGGDPNSLANLNSNVLADGKELSINSSRSHPLQQAGQKIAPGTTYTTYSIVTVFVVTETPKGGGEPVSKMVRPGDQGYRDAAYYNLDIEYTDGSSHKDSKPDGMEIEAVYEVVATENKR